MFSRRITIQHRTAAGTLGPCPIHWLDNFAMRNFTNDAIFDDTLPVADGLLEIGNRIPLDGLQSSMEDWFHRKSYLPKHEGLHLTEQ
jgi:hypothetical protein